MYDYETNGNQSFNFYLSKVHFFKNCGAILFEVKGVFPIRLGPMLFRAGPEPIQLKVVMVILSKCG